MFAHKNEPDFDLICKRIKPATKCGDYLTPLLEHAHTWTLCTDPNCGTCGSGPFLQTLRWIWSKDQRSVSKDTYSRMSHSPLSVEESLRLLGGLKKIAYPKPLSEVRRQTKLDELVKQHVQWRLSKYRPHHNLNADKLITLVDEVREQSVRKKFQLTLFDFQENSFANNPMMNTIYIAWRGLRNHSRKRCGDEYGLMQRSLTGSYSGDIYQKMMEHAGV